MRLFERSKKGLVPEAAGGIMVISGAGAARAGTAQVAAAPVHAEPSLSLPEMSDVGCTEVRTTDDLPPFSRVLYDDLSLAQSLRHQICPVLIEAAADGQRGKFAFILLADMRYSDYTDEILRQAKLRWDAADPLFYTATPQVMTALSRGVEGSTRQEGIQTTGLRNASGLWQTFLAAAQFAKREQASDIHFEPFEEELR
ncbi:MAG TPA: pilus assembly protein, partial [Cupriavidus sp.]|nr:pilus assembly protein [Cupriavidus sp.]